MTDAWPARRLAAFDGLALCWRDLPGPPDRPPVLCLPGLARNSRDFDHVAKHLGGRHRVVALDYAGHGRSDRARSWRRYRPETHLLDVQHLLVAAGVHRPVVIGTSLGGLLGMALAALQPRVLSGLILNDAGPEMEAAGLSHVLDYLGSDRPQSDWEAARRDLQQNFPSLSFRTPEAWDIVTRNTFRKGPDGRFHFDFDPRITRPTRAYLRRPADLWPLYQGLRRLPVLALRGERSALLSRETFGRMKAEKPDLKQVTVAGTGHAPALNEEEAVEAMDEFLAQL